MSTNKTENLNLHSWVPTDPVRRAEFNENFDAIDENAGSTWDEVMGLKSTVAALPQNMVVGEYTGDGTDSRTISVGFTPKAVLLMCTNAEYSFFRTTSGYHQYGGLFTPELALKDYYNEAGAAEVVEGGFRVRNTSIAHGNITSFWATNQNGIRYRYLAIG